MSYARNKLHKSKRTMRKAMGDLTINCPVCGTPVPQEEFLKKDMGRNYRCKMCNNVVYDEWVKGLDFSDVKIPEVPKVEETEK